MRIAITGASGFIGRELLNEIGKTDTNVVALTRDASDCTGSEKLIWRETDYSKESLELALQDVEVIVHLAGVRGTTTNREDYVINETITENILKAMVTCKVSRIVFASTISVYNDVSTIPWKEDSKLEARTMYGESKIACEKMIVDYAQKNGFVYSILRIAQVIGLGEKRRGMMNVFIDTAKAGGELKVIGKSVAKRQYVYVEDLVKAMKILAMQIERGNQIFNVGMIKSYTNLEIAKIVNEVFENITPINYDDSQPETIKSSCMNTEKIREEFNIEFRDMKKAVSKLANKKGRIIL